MTCSELSRLQAIASTYSEKLTRHGTSPQAANEFAAAQAELADRRAAFSADLDVLFHKACCAECKRAVSAKAAEERAAEAAPIPGDYRRVA